MQVASFATKAATAPAEVIMATSTVHMWTSTVFDDLSEEGQLRPRKGPVPSKSGLVQQKGGQRGEKVRASADEG